MNDSSYETHRDPLIFLFFFNFREAFQLSFVFLRDGERVGGSHSIQRGGFTRALVALITEAIKNHSETERQKKRKRKTKRRRKEHNGDG